MQGIPQAETPRATAPGAPGRPARWASGAKSGVGTALGTASSVWFTLSHGILTEVFYPALDTASTRDLQLLVADGRDFFSEEKRDTVSEIQSLALGVPAYRLLNTCRKGHYQIEKEVLADPRRSAVLQRIAFAPKRRRLGDYCVCALLAPHLGNQGAENTAWVGDYKGLPLLFAERGSLALALACSAPWKKRSAGFVGVSDGWQDLSRHKRLTWEYERADNGTVGLTGEIDLEACAGQFVLVLAFGRDAPEAGQRARASLLQGFDDARRQYLGAWKKWHKGLQSLGDSPHGSAELYRVSATVMRVHEAKDFPGAVVASLAVPWGDARGDGRMGYHLVWPRDMIHTIGGLLAVRKHEDARRVLFYLYTTQEADGHWPQNMFLAGHPFWRGVQLDETAFAILMVGLARKEKALKDADVKFLWPMLRRAAGFLVRNGPLTPMDRWEEIPGYYASTLAVEIPALLVAAEAAELVGETALAAYFRETADAWNEEIERLLYVRGTDLARRAGVDGYYVRLARPDQLAAPAPADGTVILPNHRPGEGEHRVAEIVSPDALTLVRFGLRAPDDPRILNTIHVIDLTCRVDTPHGPCWHRYTDDGYGEHADGTPFDGTGIGRAWPLLTGERAHYELAAGRKDEAERLSRTMEAFAGDGGLLPEQIWDAADLPDKELYFGRPTGSAMPLVWAHAEYVKLRRSLHDGQVFDVLPEPVQRYLVEKKRSAVAAWRFEQPRRTLPAGRTLRLELMAPARVRWSSDDWKTSRETTARDTGVGVHVADLPTQNLPGGSGVVFTFYWPEASRWEGHDFRVTVETGSDPRRASTAPGKPVLQSSSRSSNPFANKETPSWRKKPRPIS